MATRRANLTIICGGLVLAVILCLGLVYLWRGRQAQARTFDPTALSITPPSSAAATRTARAFLDSWAAQRVGDAAARTDSPRTASLALRGYADGLHLTRLVITHVQAGTPVPIAAATRIAFTVTASVAGGIWTYPDSLDVVADKNGNTAVRWAASVLHPALKDDQSLVAGRLDDADVPADVVAADGRTKLSGFRSLLDVAHTIGKNSASSGGRQALGVASVGSNGAQVRSLHVFTAQQAPRVRTTIDAHLQAAAERAVTSGPIAGHAAGAVALDWRTGHILAIAYAGGDGDIAINAVKAPGSTMKIITAAALFDQAGMSPASPAPCPDSVLARGQTFHNDSGVVADEHMTLERAFVVSCNTAYIKDGFNALVNDGDASALHREAAEVFGMGSWSIGGGVGTRDPSIPPDVEGGDQAAQLIGQGKVTATPLFMASVAATVRAQGFHQPIIVAGQRQVRAARPISARTSGYLQEMMAATATSGTAAPRLGGLAGAGAKTGTAEEGDHTNGWLTAYDDRIAVAALVEGGRSGVDSAGYVVRDLLTSD